MTPTPVLPSLPDRFYTQESPWLEILAWHRARPGDEAYAAARAVEEALRSMLHDYARRAIESLSRAPDRPSDDALWDQTLRERDNYHEWADKLSERISRFIGLDIGEHGSANNPWARAIDMIPRGTLTEALASRAPAEPVATVHYRVNKDGERKLCCTLHEGVKVDCGTTLYAHPTESAGPAPAGMLLVSEAALRQIARAIEGLKRECGMDPESPQAIRNAQYMSLAYAVRKLGESHEG